MELPDFTSLWEASNTLQKLQESLLKESLPKIQGGNQKYRRRDPESCHNYYSDGICGVSFGIAEPEFANPLATCCQQHFFTAAEFNRHTTEHIVCPGVPGTEDSSCGRSIHPTAIAFHLETEHAIANSTTDARRHDEQSDPALKRWREARRRNYPTFERVQAKIREVGYRIDRGQVLLTRKFGSLNSRKPQELKKPRDENSKRPKLETNCAETLPSVEQEGTPEGVADLPTVQDEEATSMHPAAPPLVSYDSDASWSERLEEADEIKTPTTLLTKKTLLEQLETVHPKNVQEKDADGDTQGTLATNSKPKFPASERCRNSRSNREKRGGRRRERRNRPKRDVEDGAAPTASTEADDEELEIDEVSARGGVKAFAAHPLVQMFAKRRNCMRHASLISKRPTLLQMLLAEEMRHERNQLMQCVRFVVKNNFFLPK
ncbi:unnamed protein product [Hydatigera taeniaeformis]|uniref:NUFIP1 domain-containing protein n=1 Tax=Hydatigena taeniaeformis TaxID=6205 RepID=A0A0R3X1M3_HYDTA|nr:unnamed protein product [Hydatigera taeniaeformis]